jgi:hypothetical protein
MKPPDLEVYLFVFHNTDTVYLLESVIITT